jgi:hypothetical protein
MHYQDARPQIKSGHVLAWSHRGWASWHDFQIQIVRMFTRSEYSHVGVAWVIGGRVFVIESVVGGIRIFPLSRLLPFYYLPIVADWTEQVEEYALAHLGEPYSKLECIQAFFEPLTIDGHWECAKLVIAIAAQMGIELGTSAIPSDVVKALMSKYNVNIILVEE